jgi:carboxypeptidase PM20D1
VKKTLFSILVLLTLLLGFLLIKTFLYKAPDTEKPDRVEVEIDKGAISRLQGAIQIPTISHPDRADTTNMIRFLSYLEEQFPNVHTELERELVNKLSVVYKWKSENPTKDPALFLAHMDVVPVDEASEAKWDYDAFAGTVKENYILGRGTLDDKGSVLSILEATETLLKKGFQPAQDIYFAFGHDEEIGGKDGAVKIAEAFEALSQRFSFIIDEGLVVITDGLAGVSKPIGLVGLAEKGAMSMTLTVELENGGHAMMPPKETAITILSDALVKIKNNPPGIHFNESVEKMFDHIGPEMKWPERIFFANQWLFRPLIAQSLSKNNAPNALIKTTLAPTIIHGGIMDNVLPSQAEAIINVRIIPGETVESVVEYVRKTIDDPRVRIESEAVNRPRDPTFVSPTDSDGFKTIRKSIYETFGDVIVSPGLVIGGTDSRHYSNLCDAIYRFMPVMISNEDLKGIHGVNEKISIENYHRMIAFYTRLIQNWN